MEVGNVMVFDGSTHVELPPDPAFLREMVISSRVYWSGRSGERLFEVCGPPGAVMYFTPSQDGKSRFVIDCAGRRCEVAAPSLPRDTWVDLTLAVRGGEASIEIAGQPRLAQPCGIAPLALDATVFRLGGGLGGGYFRGKVDMFSVSHPR